MARFRGLQKLPNNHEIAFTKNRIYPNLPVTEILLCGSAWRQEE